MRKEENFGISVQFCCTQLTSNVQKWSKGLKSGINAGIFV